MKNEDQLLDFLKDAPDKRLTITVDTTRERLKEVKKEYKREYDEY